MYPTPAHVSEHPVPGNRTPNSQAEHRTIKRRRRELWEGSSVENGHLCHGGTWETPSSYLPKPGLIIDFPVQQVGGSDGATKPVSFKISADHDALAALTTSTLKKLSHPVQVTEAALSLAGVKA